MNLTRHELEVMETLWVADRPLPRNEIIERSPKRTWSASTVHILLNGLLEKDMIKEAGFVKRGKTFGRLYAPKITSEEYYSGSVFPAEQSIPLYFSALFKDNELSPDLITDLEGKMGQWKTEMREQEIREQAEENDG